MERLANIDDLPLIVKLKLCMFEEAGLTDILAEDAYERILNSYKELYEKRRTQHFVIEKRSQIVACAGAFLKDDLRYCFFRKQFYGFIGDVYTLPDYRRRGYARGLTIEAINWLKGHEVEMIRLLATPKARSLYEELGFQSTDEMVLFL